MSKSTRSHLTHLALAVAVIATAATGCSSAPDEKAAPSSAPSSSAPASGAPSSESSPSSSPASSSSSSADAESGQESDSGKGDAAKEGASAPTLISLGKKLGCKDPEVKTPKAGDSVGINAAIYCEASGNTYIVASTPNQNFDQVVESFRASSDDEGTWYYVEGTGWLGLAVKSDSKVAPTKSDASGLQSKIGGSVKSST